LWPQWRRHAFDGADEGSICALTMQEPRAAARPEGVPGGPSDHGGASGSQRQTRCPGASLDREWQDEYSPGMDGGYRLITIPPSHVCFALRLYRDLR